jgi:hypothetical protein
VALAARSRRVELNHRFLKDADGMIHHFLAFPFAVAQPRFRYESALNVVRAVSDQLPGTNTSYYAVQHWAEAAEADGSYRVVLVPREAQMIQFGRNWPDYISQAHHGSRPAGFPETFVSAPDGFGSGHMYAYLTSNNFRTNFPVSQEARSSRGSS